MEFVSPCASSLFKLPVMSEKKISKCQVKDSTKVSVETMITAIHPMNGSFLATYFTDRYLSFKFKSILSVAFEGPETCQMWMVSTSGPSK